MKVATAKPSTRSTLWCEVGEYQSESVPNIIENSLLGVMISASDTNEVNYNTRIRLFIYF